MAGRNLINAENVTLNYGKGPVLDSVSLGLSEGDRIGVVGRNGGGKSSLIRILTGVETPNSGRVSRTNDINVGSLSQMDSYDPNATVRDIVLGTADDHHWATDAAVRDVLNGLFGGFDEHILERTMGPLSGGEKRRVALAKLLVSPLDVLLLDEPTNHLDVEAVAWLAKHLKSRKSLALVTVTHDRWFLDEVSDYTWEVVDGAVEEYEGGYSAFVLAKVERQRQASVADQKRNMLIRKELAWLRRGAPARTSKPKFRIDAANELIENEPPPRNNVELLAFANARLGKMVFELNDIDVRVGEKELFRNVTWNIGPGDRIGVVGVNGAGKTTMLRILTQDLKPVAGKFAAGVTVKIAFLSQHLDELDRTWRLVEAVERVASHIEIGKGKTLSAGQLLERLGFPASSHWTPVGDLSGGERRRLQLTRLLMSGPNVLILDEPTNDFDVETLASLEDLLDSFGGTLIVVSHDRYFMERACDTFVGILGDGKVTDLPRGIEQYLELRAKQINGTYPSSFDAFSTSDHASLKPALSAAQRRELEKDLGRVERQLVKVDAAISLLHTQLNEHATDYEKVAELNTQLREQEARKNELEEKWLVASEPLN
ncbi:MAG: ABC-F family ATP-binding cassette domain-containing protein [Actinomycetes bacterium]